MKRKEITVLVVVAVISGVVALVVSGFIFTGPNKRTKVPEAEAVSSTFPDIKNDPAYQSFFNNRALDPTQPIQIGNSKNTTPFR